MNSPTFKVVKGKAFTILDKAFINWRVEAYVDGEFENDWEFSSEAKAKKFKADKDQFFADNPGAFL
jgi:hypothetical protein